MVDLTESILPPTLRDDRALGFAAAIDGALAVDPWQACPLALEHTASAMLWPLAVQFGVAGPLWQAMATDTERRALLAVALRLQRHRGTPWAVAEVVRLLGYREARVLDRQTLLRYDGEALFNGAYTFDSALPSWAHYKIRVVPGIWPFTEAARNTAALLAQDWAPLRCRFAGWEVRISEPVFCVDPDLEASRIRLVALEAVGGLESFQVPSYWIAKTDGLPVIRFRLASGAMAIPNIGRVSILRRDGSELASIPVPRIDGGPVVIEGAFELRKG